MAIFNMVWGGWWWIVEIKDWLCFTANTASSTIKLNKTGSPTAVTLETSKDWITWTTYTIWDTITLTNVWDKVYWRNTSETDTGLNTSPSHYYKFVMTWSIAWSWDMNFLLNKNSTDTVSGSCYGSLFQWCTSLTSSPKLPSIAVAGYSYQYMFDWCTSLTTPPVLPATFLNTRCYFRMFNWCTGLTSAPVLPAAILASWCYGYMFSWCTSLTTPPKLPATILGTSCYEGMFFFCSWLTKLPSLPATTLANKCYYQMFHSCSNIKMSKTQTWAYQTAYRIPTTWTWTTATDALGYMFYMTGWTFKSDPSINTTYYTSNTLV